MKRSQERSHGRPRRDASRQEQLPRESVSASCNRRRDFIRRGKEPRTEKFFVRRPRFAFHLKILFLKTRLSISPVSRMAMGAPAMAPAMRSRLCARASPTPNMLHARDSRVERRMQSHRVLCTRTTRLRQHPLSTPPATVGVHSVGVQTRLGA